jgi:hypothetical protein
MDVLQQEFPYSSYSPNVTPRELICKDTPKEEKFCDSKTKSSSGPTGNVTCVLQTISDYVLDPKLTT